MVAEIEICSVGRVYDLQLEAYHSIILKATGEGEVD
jgi:hypothetical protein